MSLFSNNTFFYAIRKVILLSRQRVFRAVNSVLLETYWNIGKIIVEEEQHGKSKAIYGSKLLKNLLRELTLEFGKGFDERNINNIRAFYNTFPIWNALRTELFGHIIACYLGLLFMPKEEDLKQIIDQDKIKYNLDR